MKPRAPWGGLAVEAPGAGEVAIFGVPYDGAVGWRQGAAQAPARLREISATSPAVSEEGFVVRPELLRVVDLGDAAIEEEESRESYFARIQAKITAELREHPERLLFSIGGDHSVSIPLLRAFDAASADPYGVVLIDAHPDLFDVYDGSKLSHACPMRRALETNGLAPEHLLIIGTRSYNPEELELMSDQGIAFVPARQVAREGIGASVALAATRLAALERVYLTIDIDAVDPAYAPGTGAPVAGGLTSRDLLELVRGLLESLPVRAMDLVEVAPPLDPTDATSFLALQLVFEVLACRARAAAAP